MYKPKQFIVIGAGPKGIAVAIKAKVFREFNLFHDQCIVIEKTGVAAHWSGEAGFTDGELHLGTPPEKDLVFPIDLPFEDSHLTACIMARLQQFTWTAYLQHTKQFIDWVDSDKPAPSHRAFAAYLNWIAAQLTPEVQFIHAEVTQIDLSPNKKTWQIQLQDQTFLLADHLLLTGPGELQTDYLPADKPIPNQLYDIKTFWTALNQQQFDRNARTAIVGAGENAASMLISLAGYAPDLPIDIITAKGFLCTRAQGYYENQFYSQPEKMGWSKLSIAQRLDFIARTDLGVISPAALTILKNLNNHRIVSGKLQKLTQEGDMLRLILTNKNELTTHYYEQVLLATGFDPIKTLTKLFTPAALNHILRANNHESNQIQLTHFISNDLSVQHLKPKLYLPNLSRLNQGPGFANLSCLGRLSDRILFPHLHFSKRLVTHELSTVSR